MNIIYSTFFLKYKLLDEIEHGINDNLYIILLKMKALK